MAMLFQAGFLEPTVQLYMESMTAWFKERKTASCPNVWVKIFILSAAPPPPTISETAKWRCFLSGCRTDLSPPSDRQSIFSRSALEYKHTSSDKPCAHGARGLHFFPSKTMAKHLGSVQFTVRVWTHDIYQNENQDFLGGIEKRSTVEWRWAMNRILPAVERGAADCPQIRMWWGDGGEIWKLGEL